MLNFIKHMPLIMCIIHKGFRGMRSLVIRFNFCNGGQK